MSKNPEDGDIKLKIGIFIIKPIFFFTGTALYIKGDYLMSKGKHS